MNKYIIGLLLIVIMVFGFLRITTAIEWDISEDVGEKGYEVYLNEEMDIDSKDPQIMAVAQSIKDKSESPEDAIKRTAEYVAKNIDYTSEMTIQDCYDEKASDVLVSGEGDCVSMSRLLAALLRAQGIPARTSGGCLTRMHCSILFATVPLAEAQTTPMTVGAFKKRGYQHEWVEVWEPTRGWFILEATSGQIFGLGCDTYLQYHYDNNNIERCVILDQSFWNACEIA